MSKQAKKKTVKTHDGSMAYKSGAWSFSAAGPRVIDKKAQNLGGIVEQLNSEHRYFSALLDQLEVESERLQPGKIPDYPLLLDIVDYLVNYPDQFHHPREDLLFGELLKVDKNFATDLKRLIREHKTLRSYNDSLFAELNRIADGRPVNRPELRRSLQRYIDGYRKHMGFESTSIFPKAKGSLNADAMARLQEKTSAIDDPLFGAQLQNRYRRLGRSLQSRIEGFSAELASREIAGIESAISGTSIAMNRIQALREGLTEVNRTALQRNKDTLKDLIPRPIGLVTLPAALMRNHGQYLQDSVKALRIALTDEVRD
ncbi:hypothetical protein EYC98_14220 [Halieaceae bacterium IMCC14734]|uniref:Hemerythrin-like domain-containing protein n=1 Tax=Candidatus Litorirhabdus singularis TaxID=2518993 RepID=A0ABT3TI67_9GAMM|nr:hemerythrin domain-containing protein [Candidatus Litorirhabdus singularis]MCX2982015.1 hypothetical protein [Candidatus Litorirhabdus singularis]